MKLDEKGSFSPRPVLEGPAETVARTIETWPSVVARTHWELGDETIVDGADFYVGQRELGHLHLYAEAHVALTPALSKAVIAAKLAKKFRWGEGFVVRHVRTEADARAVEWLFRLAYDRLTGTSIPALLERVAAHAESGSPSAA